MKLKPWPSIFPAFDSFLKSVHFLNLLQTCSKWTNLVWVSECECGVLHSAPSLNIFIPILFGCPNQTLICTFIHLSLNYLFALLFIYSFNLLTYKRETYLIRSAKLIKEISGFLRQQPVYSNTLHSRHASWIYLVSPHSKPWRMCMVCIRYNSVGACNLIGVGKNSHSVGRGVCNPLLKFVIPTVIALEI